MSTLLVAGRKLYSRLADALASAGHHGGRGERGRGAEGGEQEEQQGGTRWTVHNVVPLADEQPATAAIEQETLDGLGL